jgi:hypothetical protein
MMQYSMGERVNRKKNASHISLFFSTSLAMVVLSVLGMIKSTNPANSFSFQTSTTSMPSFHKTGGGEGGGTVEVLES